MDIILYLLQLCQYLYQQNCWLISFICRYIPLRQWAFDDSHSPEYQKYRVDEPPLLGYVGSAPQDWNWKDLLKYYRWKYGKELKPVQRRKTCDIPENVCCPRCGAPMIYLYKNNGDKGQLLCKVCGDRFFPDADPVEKHMVFRCPFCGNALVPVKSRKFFIVHKCVIKKCSYYLDRLKKIHPDDPDKPKYLYKLHYIYREFTVDFFKVDLRSLPDNASSLKFRTFNPHIMGLCLTMHVNLGLSLRKTSQALKDLYGISISHQQVANYARTAALMIKPFVDNYDYDRCGTYVGDETYIRVKGEKSFLWLIIDAASRSILGYRVSDNRGVGPCILTMRMAFRGLTKLPENFRFIADGYSAYVLAAQQFFHEYGKDFKFHITQVIGLTNDDEVTREFRPFKQLIERLNRTYKETYRVKCGYDNYDGANYNVALWVAYYNFLRPHKEKGYQVLNRIEMLEQAENMPAKWQLLIYLGQQTIKNLQRTA